MISHLTAVSTYGAGAGSTRVRLYDWLDHLGLSSTRYEYLGGSSLGIKRVLRRPRATLKAELEIRRLSSVDHDLGTVVLSRRASPFSTGAVERKLLMRSRRGVYDFDDALYAASASRSPAERVWRNGVESASLVIAGNRILADAALHYSSNVVVIPSCVEPARYPTKKDYQIKTPTVVWMGSPSTEKYLNLVQEALLQMHKEIGLTLIVVSAGLAPLGPLDEMTRRVEWGDGKFLKEVAHADVGIMPLPDNEWSRGKCAYKLLEYGAIGLPMIGSPVGANEHVLKGATGWAPKSTDEWVDSLREVFSETHARRSHRGQVAREFVEQEYSFGAWAERWQAAVLGQMTV